MCDMEHNVLWITIFIQVMEWRIKSQNDKRALKD